MVNGSHLTVTWHVDDLKISHKDPAVVEQFVGWLEETHGDANGSVTVDWEPKLNCIGMDLDFSEPQVLKVDMSECIKDMVKEFVETIAPPSGSKAPWTDRLFQVNEDSPALTPAQKEVFHTHVAKALFAACRGRPDIRPAVAFLTTRVRAPTDQDWIKLIKMMDCLKSTEGEVLRLGRHEEDDSLTLHWFWDASFAVHEDFRSHTGGNLTAGMGAILSASQKQKLNSRSSREAELIAVDDGMSTMLWSKLFLEAQGVQVKENVLCQDNKSAILLEKNGKASSSKRTRHLNIRFFFITDQANNHSDSRIQFCPTAFMLADCNTKPQTGAKFESFQSQIMGKTPVKPFESTEPEAMDQSTPSCDSTPETKNNHQYEGTGAVS